MPKVYPFLNTQYKSADGTFPIVIYIYHKRRKLHPTGYKSSKKDWDDEKRRVKKTHQDHSRINALLDGLMAQASTYQTQCTLQQKPFNINHVFDAVAEDQSFLAFIQNQVDRFRAANRHHAANKYQSGSNLLKEWYGGDVLFSDITERFVSDYDAFMRDSRKNSVSTRIQKISELASLYKTAADKGLAPRVNHFALHEIKEKRTPKIKDWITEEEIQRLEQLELKKENLHITRDMYLFSVYCRGMRFSNLLYLKKSDIRDGRVFWVPAKQDKMIQSQKLHSKLSEIIKRNLDNHEEFLFLRKKERAGDSEKERTDRAIYLNKDYNRWLKRIAEMAKIDKHLTFHTARHTFAVGAMNKTKNLSIVKDLIGHSDLRSTQIYARGFGIDFLDDLNDVLYGS